MAPTKKPHYINNPDFFKALCEYKIKVDHAKKEFALTYKNWKGISSTDIEPVYIRPKIPEYIGKCIWLIANKLSGSPNFCSYSYRDEMVADGIEDAILRIDSFDPSKSQNPFAYFTQICYFAAVRRIKKEKKQKLVKSEMVKNSGIIDTMASERQEGDDAVYTNSYLSFLLENVDNGNQSDADKDNTQRFKKTTKAHQKRKREADALLPLPREEDLEIDDLEDEDAPLYNLLDKEDEQYNG